MILDEYNKLAMNLGKPVKYVILNREAYSELVAYYSEVYRKVYHPDTIMDHPIVLDVKAKERIKIISNCYTEFQE